MHGPHIWILVADGETARIYSSSSQSDRLETAVPFEFRMSNPPTREQGTERPGRVYESSGMARHAAEPRVDWHREQKREFAREIGRFLQEKTRDGAFDVLLLAAPPQMMGDLREELDPATRKLVSGEIVKDMTHLGPQELQKYLSKEDWI